MTTYCANYQLPARQYPCSTNHRPIIVHSLTDYKENSWSECFWYDIDDLPRHRGWVREEGGVEKLKDEGEK